MKSAAGTIARSVWRLAPDGFRSRLREVWDARQQRSLAEGWVRELRSAAESVSARCLEGVEDLATWERTRGELRRQLRWMLGLHPEPQRRPPSARVTAENEGPGYTVENVVLESLPGLLVAANFYRPAGLRRPAPCILYLCGHQIHPLGAKTQYQERFLWFAENGFACLVVDPLQCGEVQGLHHGMRSLGRREWLSQGYTPAGVEVWNGMRAIDWLETRSEVDPSRIGVTGTSGGGVMTWFLAGLDERVRVVAPSASTYTMGSQVARRLVASQCDCTFFPNTFGVDLPAVAALTAPRPLLVVAGRSDRIFPPAGYRPAFETVERIYRLYRRNGSERPLVRLGEWNRGHSESARSIEEIRRWMWTWLGPTEAGEPQSFSRPPDRLLDPSSLVCMSKAPPTARNFFIHRDFVPPLSPPSPDLPKDWSRRRAEILRELADKVFRWFPGESAGFAAKRLPLSGGAAGRFARYSEWTIASEGKCRIELQLFEPPNEGSRKGILVVVRRGEETFGFPCDETLPLLGRFLVVVVTPRFAKGAGSAAERATTERIAALSGRSLDALAVWDVIRAIRWVCERTGSSGSDVTLYGRREAGVIALYAALFEAAVDHVVVDEPPSTHRIAPVFPSVLRICDVPEAASCLAPRRLTFLSELAEGFELTAQVFERIAPGMMRIEQSLVAAVLSVPVPDEGTPASPAL